MHNLIKIYRIFDVALEDCSLSETVITTASTKVTRSAAPSMPKVFLYPEQAKNFAIYYKKR